MQHDEGNQGRREPLAGSHSGEDPAIRDATFLSGYPAGHEVIGRRIDHRLASAEQEPNGYKQGRAPRYRGEPGG